MGVSLLAPACRNAAIHLPVRVVDLEDEGHTIPAHSVEMDHLLADVSHQESPDDTKAMLSAMVVLKENGEPGAGFYRLAREEFGRKGDNVTIWGEEMKLLARDFRQS